ncbi:transposase [Streptomyces globisporus]|uniref:transposase n=1 Tax=Streptomyces globisporus TaxID=1908 RepID=UPI003819114E
MKADVVFGEGVGVLARQEDRRRSGGDGPGGPGCVPKGQPGERIRDELGELFPDADFGGLYPARGKPAWSPGRLALVSIMQFDWGLSDRQAADAVRGRLDGKYLLGLELVDPGFDHSVLTEFRDRLIAGNAGIQLLDRVLEAAAEHGLLKAGGRARTDSTIVLSAARQIDGLVRLGETLRSALNGVATHEPEWLAGWAPPEWFDRYAIRFEDTRLPKGKVKQTELIEQIGADGLRLLAALHAPDAPGSLRLLDRVQNLRQMWNQQYFVDIGQSTAGTSRTARRARTAWSRPTTPTHEAA